MSMEGGGGEGGSILAIPGFWAVLVRPPSFMTLYDYFDDNWQLKTIMTIMTLYDYFDANWQLKTIAPVDVVHCEGFGEE